MQPQSLSEKPAEAKASRGKILFFPPWGFFLSTMVERKKPHGGKKETPWWKERNPMVERISKYYRAA